MYLQPPNQYSWCFVVICRHAPVKRDEKFELLNRHISKVKEGHTLLCCFTSHTVNERPFAGYFCHVFHISVLLLVIALFDMAPKYSVEVMCSVPKHKKTDVLYGANTCVR